MPAALRGLAAPTAARTSTVTAQRELKVALLDTLYGTERGLAASSDTRAEVSELVTQLEARNPTPEPNEARGKLSGAWRLVYTSNSELLALLALGRLPLLSVGEITQQARRRGVRSPKLLQVKFEEGRLATPELLGEVSLPSSVEIAGQLVDLAPLQLGGLLSGAPPLTVPLSRARRSSTWLLNTYLDDSLRVTRGDRGSVYVLVKDAPGGAAGDGSTAGAAPDWEALEELEPPSALGSDPLVEPSAVIEGGGSAGSSAGSSVASGGSP
eukprot:scaffold3.g6433.t1